MHTEKQSLLYKICKNVNNTVSRDSITSLNLDFFKYMSFNSEISSTKAYSLQGYSYYQNQTWVCYPHRKPIYWPQVVGRGKCSIYYKAPHKENGWLVLKAQTHQEVSAKAFKKPSKGEGPRVCDQLMHTALIGWWWGNRVSVTGVNISTLRHKEVCRTYARSQ